MENRLIIELLDPKVRGILQELEFLGLIKIVEDSVSKVKMESYEKLKGMNLKDL